MKYLKAVVLAIISMIIFLLVQQYLFCPQIEFYPSTPFSGNKWYNPYINSQPANWLKCNFHAHTHAWGGLTNGHGTAPELFKTYKEEGYQVMCVSNYHKIDTTGNSSNNYIPAYEHGVNLKKTHQLSIGNTEVVWLDYLFPQTLSNKQHILDKLLASGNGVIEINHPQMRHGYSISDMALLNNYQCMEVLNPQATSFPEWDAALSAGKPVFATANDDLHNIDNEKESGNFCTWVNSSVAEKDSVVSCLKTGVCYAMRVARLPAETRANRLNRLNNQLPRLIYQQIRNDSLMLQFSGVVKEIVFSGREGKILSKVAGNSSAAYPLEKADEYVRCSAYFEDGTEIFLNPVYRYDSDPLRQTGSHAVKKIETALFVFLGMLVLAGWLWVLRKIYTGKRLGIK
jgi:hypothetical protein